MAHAVRMEIARDVAKLETVRRGQRQHDIVLGRRRLQLEIEFAAEALAQGQAPGAIEAAAERRMDDELHAARLVEEALEDDRLLRRQRAKRGEARGEIFDELLGRGRDDADFARRASDGRVARTVGAQPRRDLGAQARDGGGKRVRSARRFAEPERNGRRLALGVLDAHRAALDALDAIGRVAELEDVARHALDGEILVDAADDVVLGLEQHLIVGGVGDGAAGGQRGRPRAAPAAQDVIDRVAMDERAAPAAAGGEALGQHAHDCVEILAGKVAEGPGAPQPIVKLALRPVLRGDFGDDLLRQHVERPLGDRRAGRVRRAGRCREARRIRRDRRATAETGGPWACRRWRGRNGRRAAGRSRSSAASRSGRRDRRRRCRCPSSSEAVATSAFSSPRLSRCSADSRSSFAMLP